MRYEIIEKNAKLENEQMVDCSWGIFNTKEDAYKFAVNRIHQIKLVCGSNIYIPYEIIERR